MEDYTKVLLPAHRRCGLTLTKEDNVLYLKQNGETKVIASYPSATIIDIWEEADKLKGDSDGRN